VIGDLDGWDSVRERERILEEGIRREAAEQFESDMRPALDELLNDADEHGLSLIEAQEAWRLGLAKLLASREPRTCGNCGRPGCGGRCG
jgi:hypothetical protein